MVDKIALKIVTQMVEDNLIQKDMEERYRYVAVCWIEKLITIGTIVLISVAIKKVLPTIFFLLFFLELRKRTGGYHLKKFYECYFATIGSYLMIVIVNTILKDYIDYLWGILVIAVAIIMLIGTVNHPNIHMTREELEESKKAARITVLLEISIIGACTLLGADTIFIGYMAIAVILCAALLCIAKILKQEVKENEKA